MARKKVNYLLYGGLAVGGYLLYRNSKGLAPIPTSIDDALNFAPSPAATPYTVYQTLPGGTGYSTPYGPYYPPVYGETIPTGTPADVVTCYNRKKGNGWSLARCNERITQLKTAYAAAKSRSGVTDNAQAVAEAQAEIAKYVAAIASHTAAMNAEADPTQKAKWGAAIAQFNDAIAQINARVAALPAAGGGAAYAQAAQGYAADYNALTGMTLN